VITLSQCRNVNLEDPVYLLKGNKDIPSKNGEKYKDIVYIGKLKLE
jgi:hypothetical protein